jgi:TorA maturation chaperone TorD
MTKIITNDQKQGIINFLRLTGNLFLGPVTEDLTKVLCQSPDIRGLIESTYGQINDCTTLTERLAVDHQGLFGRAVFPYKEEFLGCSTDTVGAHALDLSRAYAAAGFKVRSLLEVRADHLGHLLLFASYLLDNSDLAKEGCGQRSESTYSAFVYAEIMPWVKQFAIAADIAEYSFYSSMIDLVFAVLSAPLVHIVPDAADYSAVAGCKMPDEGLKACIEDQLLTNPKTGIREIATYLLQPERSGFFLSRIAMQKVSAGLNLPGGFGTRLDVLENLFASAIQFDVLGDFTNEILEHLDRWHQELVAVLEVNNATIDQWTRNNRCTASLLRTIGSTKADCGSTKLNFQSQATIS